MSVYPALYAGQRITADLLRGMVPQFVYKTSDENRTNTATMADDAELFIDLEANATYRVEFIIHYSASAAGGFKTEWGTPANSSGLKGAWGVDTSPTSTSNPTGDGRWGVHGFTTDIDYGTRNGSNQVMAWETGHIDTVDAGILVLRWAQSTSDASTTRVAQRSLLRVWRLA